MNSLILHFFIMMIIPLIRIILPKKPNDLKADYTFLLFIVFSLILTITYPVHIMDGTTFDLKLIPVFIAFFYVSINAGILMIGFIVLFKGITDPSGIFFLILNYTIFTAIFLSIRRYFLNGTFIRRLMIGLLFYIPISISRLILFMNNEQLEDVDNLLIFSLMSMITLVVTIYLIELDQLKSDLRNKLQTADKMNAISQLAASVAHEIRNPMTTVKGFMQLMQTDQNLNQKQQQYISVSLKELERTNQIISDFLTLAKPSYSLTEMIHLEEVINDVVIFMQSFAHISNVSLIASVNPNLYIKGNPNELKQLLINLIKNGIESMENGGNIEVMAVSEGEYAIVSLKDEGAGISKKQLKQIGQPYYSTKSRGTGLGLMIAFDIIKRMNGQYKITSEEGIGTSFIIMFPSVSEE
ncbi:two-component system sporulation sensor kinase B [Cytobacillus purgationiresistens]|uniref:histidine kinase n=2 Tax=Cytobacillus purgationiresistens TaxID=863449 RepID=A0ABU0ABW6_9BACI|nr:two-component system sporulation sensor kinase B [Cytobacillus purgationiresistens]